MQLPLVPEPREERCPDAPTQPAANLRRRLLVVDDNRDVADTLVLLLEVLGAEARVAYEGQAAVEAVRADRPDAVLLDIGMPGMDGYEVARRIRAESDLRDVFLVALTGWAQDDDRRRTREAGFDAHLVKPVDLTALRKLLADCRPRSGSARALRACEKKGDWLRAAR